MGWKEGAEEEGRVVFPSHPPEEGLEHLGQPISERLLEKGGAL